MKKPEMIMFDYGHTLIYEPAFDRAKGYEAVLAHALKNSGGHTPQKMAELYRRFFGAASDLVLSHDVEFMALSKNRLLYDYLELSFDLPPVELERVFWDSAAPGTPMPNIEKLIELINSLGIRSAVISNLSFCSENLAERINRLIPNNRFEFFMVSCEYALRKPNRLIFQTALKKANLSPDRVWYCGDNRRADVAGAAGAGIFPVWYDSGADCQYRTERDEIEPECEYLRVGDWLELADILRSL
jgi:putative hydrolase of the HAD superfamily